MVLEDTKEGQTGYLVFEKKRFMRRVGQPQEVVRSFVSRRSFRVFSSRRRRWNGMNATALSSPCVRFETKVLCGQKRAMVMAMALLIKNGGRRGE
jgi:hypothetical protein